MCVSRWLFLPAMSFLTPTLKLLASEIASILILRNVCDQLAATQIFVDGDDTEYLRKRFRSLKQHAEDSWELLSWQSRELLNASREA